MKRLREKGPAEFLISRGNEFLFSRENEFLSKAEEKPSFERVL
jgi:hypothetical protein